MESVETLIPDNEGNHLVVALNFYEDSQKADTFQLPREFIVFIYLFHGAFRDKS